MYQSEIRRYPLVFPSSETLRAVTMPTYVSVPTRTEALEQANTAIAYGLGLLAFGIIIKALLATR
jgi:hypothetical protein